MEWPRKIDQKENKWENKEKRIGENLWMGKQNEVLFLC